MNKKARDNRANQLNPNNMAYWKSRANGKGKSNTRKGSSARHSSTSYSSLPKYVSNPQRGLFGKLKGSYGWVICDHCGNWLSRTSFVEWTSNFERAVVFKSEKEARHQVDIFMKDSTSWGGKMVFFRIKCIEFDR